MAEAVLTPRNNDLESGMWTRAAPLTSLRISAKWSTEKKKKRSGLFASNETEISHGRVSWQTL
jgi:hypothetical protein